MKLLDKMSKTYGPPGRVTRILSNPNWIKVKPKLAIQNRNGQKDLENCRTFPPNQDPRIAAKRLPKLCDPGTDDTESGQKHLSIDCV